MRKLISNTALVAIAAGGMLFVSCGDHDMFNPNYKAEEYALNWEQKIGAVDPNQDWSMATSVTASINVAAAGNGVLNIYTENPVHSTARLLAKVFLNNGSGSATFDAVKGADQVFVVASNNGKNVVYGWADIVNGQVNAGKTVAKKAAKTRAGEYCPVTKGKEEELSNIKYTTEDPNIYIWNNAAYTWDELVEITQNVYNNLSNKNEFQYKGQYEIPFVASSIIAWKHVVDEHGNEWNEINGLNFENAQLQSNAQHGATLNKSVVLTMLNNVEKKAVQTPWTLAWGYELFGPGAFFEEQIRYDNTVKKNLPGYNLQEVEQGFSITTSKDDSEVTVPFMYGSTDGQNRFGYVYYKGDLSYDEILAQPHYILMEDATPASNIFYDEWGKAENTVGPMGLAQACKDGKDSQREVYGTEYKLAFFGENHKEAASYQFPQGYHIVFFIAPYSGGYKTDMYNYSLPELNKLIGHYQKDSNGNTDTNRGNVMATAWKYNGKVFMGMEDKAYYVDADLNDVVFWVEGDFTPDQEIPEVPSTTQPKEESQSWILACEDLGSTDDYDFNDIVLEVRTKIEIEETFKGQAKTGETFKKATLQVRCLAAGGKYQANIAYDNGRVNIGESHALLGRPGSSDMLNTKTLDCPFSEWITLEETTNETTWGDIQNDNSWSIDKIAKKIQIVVTADDKTGTAALISAPTTGEAPQMIIVPGDWQWPTERAHIEEAYPDFKNWNSNASFTDWYNTKVANNVIAR